MQRTPLSTTITLALALMAGQAVHGQSTSAYFQAVTNLNPAGYWPLNETVQPPPPFSFNNTATNLGTLGAQANGYYGAWYQASNTTWYLTNSIAQAPAVTAPIDGSVGMNCQDAPGQYVILPRTTNGVINPTLTLTPPFTIEAWVNLASVSKGLLDIVSEGGYVTANYGGPTNNPFNGGLGLGFAGVELATYNNEFFFVCNGTNAESKSHELDGTQNLTVGTWHHVVATFTGTTEQLYVNGVSEGTKVVTSQPAAGANAYVPHPSAPLMVGGGGEPAATYGNDLFGTVDDVAIYPEILPLTSISNHFQAAYGTNATYSTYVSAVLADSPTIYYRLNDTVVQTNAGYPTNLFPVATNYGSIAGANGLYQPGTTPGVAGPAYAGFGASSKSVAINGWFGGVDVGGGSLPAALNPTGILPMTLVTWFRGNIADAPARFQEMVGHGDSSYRLAMGQVSGENHFNPGPGPELQFTTAAGTATNGWAFNDGTWHMVAGVTDGTNDYMYLDGMLAQSNSTATGINIAGNTNDLLLGGDSEYTYASWGSANTIRNFDGQIAHVAFWTNAVSAAGIQSLFNAAGVPPSIGVPPVGATNNQGNNLTITAQVRGSQPVSYQWYMTNGANGTPVAGQTNVNLTYAPVTTNAIGGYYLVATSPYGAVTSSVVQVFVYGSPAVATESQPNINVYAGSSPSLYVTMTGAQPITYQWLSNGVPIPSATNNTYSLANAQSSATYTCGVTNSVGYLIVGPFTLTILADPTAPYPAKILSDHPLAFWRLDESSGTIANDYVGGNDGTYSNVLLDFSTCYNPITDPTEGDAPGFGILITNNSYVGMIPTNVNFATPTNNNGEFSVECWLQEALVYDDNGIISLGYGNGGEEFALDCGGSDPAHNLRFYVRNTAGTSSGAVSTFAPNSDGNWHHAVGVCDEANGHVYLYIDGTNAGSASITTKSGILTSTQSLTIGARQEALNSQFDNQFIGQIDEVAVYNYALTPAQVSAHYFASGIKPNLQVTPANETTNVGSTASFSVAATGTPTLYYMWYDPNGNLISTNAMLNISNVQASAQGQYTVVVTNSYGSATGTVYLQVVLGPPQIAQDISPLMQTVNLYAGLDTISFSVVASGSVPFTYQWYEDGSKVTGATNATYSFTAAPGTNTYYVTVTNAYTASQAGGVPASSSTATVVGVGAPQLNPTNYSYRALVSFPGYQGFPLTNFPALITLSPSTIAGFSYSQFASNGTDLRFTDATGTNLLPYEIDEWDDSGTSSVWVLIPLLNGTNIWAYWGDAADTNVAVGSTNVWLDAGYQIVYHLKENGFPFADSTGQYPATNGVAPTPTNGVVGHAEYFNGSSEFITPGPVTLSNQFTTYAWFYIPSSAANIQTIWCNQKGGYGNNGFSLFVNTYNTSDGDIHYDSGNDAGSGADPNTGAGTVTDGQWHFLATTWDRQNSVGNVYLDGRFVQQGGVVSSFALTNQLNLGAFLDPDFYFTGPLDEARVQYGIATTNWVVATYQNMADPSAFVSFSSVNLEPPLSISVLTNGYVLSWPTNDGTFTLESTTNLTPPAVWSSVSGSSVVTNGVNEQIVQPVNGNTFYRLQGQ